jgi:hypothetical protein
MAGKVSPGLSWMGDSRGRWEGDTLVVEVKDFNDQTWLDAAGNYHSDALTVVERYNLRDADTIQYEATITDPKVFSKPWKISMPIHRIKDMPRILEHQCQAEREANGLNATPNMVFAAESNRHRWQRADCRIHRRPEP